MAEATFTDDTFTSQVLEHQGLTLVDFYAPWCGPCKMMAPTLDKLAHEYEGKVVIGKLNVDENDRTAMQYDIRSIPTLIFFKDGEMVARMEGFQSEEVLRGKLQELQG